MSRSAAAASGVWLLSCLPVALPVVIEPAATSLGDASRLHLAAIPWLAWAGMPRASHSALCAPPLAAALAVDLSRGAPIREALFSAAACLAMVLLLGAAAALAASGRGALRTYAWAWAVLVPGLPSLRCALELGGAPAFGAAPAWLALPARCSPIAWAFDRAAETGGSASTWPALAVCLVLFAVALAHNRSPALEEASP